MADQNVVAEELLLDIKVAEASALYKLFLALWEFMGGAWSAYNPISVLRINPMFMSAPSLVAKAAYGLFASGEIYNDLYVSGIEFFWGYTLSVIVAIPFGIAIGWYKKLSYIFDPFVNAMNATPRVALLPLIIIWLGIGILSKSASSSSAASFLCSSTPATE
jgi:ABC-type nitrate/sulfonate/bicarbonate transport system permease component